MSSELDEPIRPAGILSSGGNRWLPGCRRRRLLLLALLALALAFSRRPEQLSRPQFWAEGGKIWYARAHSDPTSFLRAHGGYLHFSHELAASSSQWLPLCRAPLYFSLIASAVLLLPALFLASGRCRNLFPDPRWRLLVAFLYLALPSSEEAHLFLATIQFRLFILAALIVLAAPPRSPSARAFDVVFVTLSGLSGPFCIFLFPLVGVRWLKRRQPWLMVLASILGACAAVEAGAVFFAAEARPELDLETGATVPRFLQILVRQVFVPGIVGSRGTTWLVENVDAFTQLWFSMAIGLAGVALVARALMRAPLELRLGVLAAFLPLLAALAWPLTHPDWPPFWTLLDDTPGPYNRHFFIPIFAWLMILLWSFTHGSKWLRIPAGLALATHLLVAVPTGWRFDPLPDLRFREQCQGWEALPAGSTRVFRILPEGWTMTLEKRAGPDALAGPPAPRGREPTVEVILVHAPPPDGAAARVEGWIDLLHVAGAAVRIDGWALLADTSERRRLHVLSEVPLTLIGARCEPREDVVRALGKAELRYSGFSLELRAEEPLTSPASPSLVTLWSEDDRLGWARLAGPADVSTP